MHVSKDGINRSRTVELVLGHMQTRLRCMTHSQRQQGVPCGLQQIGTIVKFLGAASEVKGVSGWTATSSCACAAAMVEKWSAATCGCWCLHNCLTTCWWSRNPYCLTQLTSLPALSYKIKVGVFPKMLQQCHMTRQHAARIQLEHSA